MQKAFCIFQKIFEIMTVCAIAILLTLPMSRVIGAQETKKIPDLYGYYLLKQGRWVEIPKTTTTHITHLRGACGMWGILGLTTKPDMVADDQHPTILIYEQDVDINLVQLARLWYFKELRAVDFIGEPPKPGFFENLCGVGRESLQPLGLWTVVGTYSFQVGPVSNRPGMFRLRPKEKLPPGIYAVYQGSQFTSRPWVGEISVPVRAFEIRGSESRLPERPSLNSPPVEIIRAVTAVELDQTQGATGITRNFRVSVKQIVGYMEVGKNRGGEVINFLWFRPDGTVQALTKNTLQPTRQGQIQYVFSRFRPNNLLMPGQWVLAIKIDGNLVKWIPFTVSIN